MKERLDGAGPLKPSGTRKFCSDIDVLRKEELKRRRLLRLEQVRIYFCRSCLLTISLETWDFLSLGTATIQGYSK